MSALGSLFAVHACLLAVMVVACAVRGAMYFSVPLWAVAVVVPVAGPASAMALVLAERSKHAGEQGETGLEASLAGPEPMAYRLDGTGDVVPLEDAMIVNDAETKRGLMMDVLLQQGGGSGRSLAMARSSSDVEVAHYASSASMELFSSLEEAFSAAEARYQKTPNDAATLSLYLGVIERYLDEGGAKGEVRRILEARYREVLQRKIAADPEEVDFERLAESQLAEGLHKEADDTITRMEALYPGTDAAWLLRLRYFYDLGRADRVRDMIEGADVRHMSQKARSAVEFWKKALA